MSLTRTSPCSELRDLFVADMKRLNVYQAGCSGLQWWDSLIAAGATMADFEAKASKDFADGKIPVDWPYPLLLHSRRHLYPEVRALLVSFLDDKCRTKINRKWGGA